MSLAFLNSFRKGNIPKTIQTVPKKTFDIQKNLNNVQNVIKMIETTRPFITEYGPMIKNLPKIYKLMKMMKSFDSDKSGLVNSIEDFETNEGVSKYNNIKSNDKQRGESVPKLYL